jgi:hypothetical protein
VAVKNPTSWRRTAEFHFLAVSLAVLLYYRLAADKSGDELPMLVFGNRVFHLRW